MAAKQQKRPYTMVFCGVNGVGKSTNLAKITYARWGSGGNGQRARPQAEAASGLARTRC